jgi:hypothetical protein
VLHYLVKLLKKNDDSLLFFDVDLVHVNQAENVILDSLGVDVNAITEELTTVKKTVSEEAQRLEDAGELKPMTLADLAEQRTTVKHVGLVPQYNKIQHHTGRTSMERFVLNAEAATLTAAQSIEDVRKKYQTLLAYFGEDPQMSTTDFFGTLRRFVAEFKKASEQVEAIEKAAVSLAQKNSVFVSIYILIRSSFLYLCPKGEREKASCGKGGERCKESRHSSERYNRQK